MTTLKDHGLVEGTIAPAFVMTSNCSSMMGMCGNGVLRSICFIGRASPVSMVCLAKSVHPMSYSDLENTVQNICAKLLLVLLCHFPLHPPLPLPARDLRG